MFSGRGTPTQSFFEFKNRHFKNNGHVIYHWKALAKRNILVLTESSQNTVLKRYKQLKVIRGGEITLFTKIEG